VRRLQDRSEVIAAILRDERDAVSFTEELDRAGAAHVEHLLANSRPMESRTPSDVLLDPLPATVHRLTNRAHRLAPAEDLLDACAIALDDGVAGRACRANVNR